MNKNRFLGSRCGFAPDPYKITVGIAKTEGICPKDEQIRNEIIALGSKNSSDQRNSAMKSLVAKILFCLVAILSLLNNFYPRSTEVGNRTVTIEKWLVMPVNEPRWLFFSTQRHRSGWFCIGQRFSHPIRSQRITYRGKG